MSPGRAAFVFRETTLTYLDVYTRVTKLAAQLHSAGVRHGDRVGYLGPNHLALVETLFATHMLGGIFVPLNFRLAAPEVDHMLEDAGAVALVYGPECEQVVHRLHSTAGLRVLVALEDPAQGERAYEPWLQAGGTEPIDVPVGMDEPALILYTSGTTGRPKGAVLTHANIVWNCFHMLIGVDVAGDEVTLINAPLFHVAALDQTLFPTFMKGACSVIMPTWDVDTCFDLVARHGVTWMFGVTTMFAALAQSDRWADADLSSLRTLMSGGASIPESLIRSYQERGLVFCQGYGLTETAPGATFVEAQESVDKAGSAGVPVFFDNVRVVRPDLSDCSPGEPGEVLIQGPNVTPGYWDNPQATAAAFSDGGWFRSGDIATVDADGHLYIVDRVKDMYISGGENVYPAEVEAALYAHPEVAEVAIVGVPDERWGEAGKAYVIRSPGATVTAEELRQFLSPVLAKYKIPRYVEFVDGLPRTGSGKVQKNRLRERS